MAVAPLISTSAQDMYLNGKGNMHVKLMSAIKIVNAKGKEMDEASLMRYFNEMQWFPSSLVSDNVTWEAIDANSARSTADILALIERIDGIADPYQEAD
jgi:hypothetical protein